MNALTISLPCRLITLTGEDVEDASSLLTQDLEALEGSLTTSQTFSLLLLQELEVSMAWTYRIIQCMQTLASTQLRKYKLSVKEQEDSVLALAKVGAWNSLEWFLAQVKLEEMQSLEVMVKWAAGALESLQEFDLRN
jgi:CheY-like chemotaxis protein